ncbi:MAG: U32 family peptidase [Elainella sp. Prado103]|nr:U32 family peptidase [Elainella sp. Prado103]
MTALPSHPPTSDPTGLKPSELKRPELLAPAGDWDCVKAAVENGADAVYFGLDRFNARMRAHNFTEADLPELMGFLHLRGVKGYITLNTLVFPSELATAEQYLRAIITAGVDAAIVQDIGICRLIRHLSPDFPIHASTQMTVTSAAGVAFAKTLGCQLVVLARECSLKEINKIQQQLQAQQMALPLEVFVHGALCVAYSGQCLTSEALGGRSANRGECAQACRMTYELIADGQTVPLGDRQYLLSPQDLAGIDVLPELIQSGISCLKIEGRLKAPEYVANVTRIYRQAIDRSMAAVTTADSSESEQQLPNKSPNKSLKPSLATYAATDEERYRLEMSFSRGLYTGWFRGIDNQALVHARFGKKRGVYLGSVTRVGKDYVEFEGVAPVKPGDGVVFDQGQPQAQEEGGRVYTVTAQGRMTRISFGRRDLDLSRVRVGDKLWKTSDPELDRQLRQTYASEIPQFQRPIDLEVHGVIGLPLTVIGRDRIGHVVEVSSTMPLVAAHHQPLSLERLQEQLGRLGNTPFELGQLTVHLEGDLLLPVSELNRLRREVVDRLIDLRLRPHRWQLHPESTYHDLLSTNSRSSSPSFTLSIGNLPEQSNSLEQSNSPKQSNSPERPNRPNLIGLVRTLEQLQSALATGLSTLYCELEDPRRYRDAVQLVRSQSPATQIYVAPPRITKPGEQWILQQVRSANADGYLIRNYDQLQFFAADRCVGDFSLNVANALTAGYFRQQGLERMTASYDLNSQQLEDLLRSCPPDWLEITIHQHMPMFHMEHCVFCAFLSEGTDYTNCGRPCETHQVALRDRVGTSHILQADAGCRNTVFNGKAQTGAEYVQRFIELGARQFRIEFVNESPSQVQQTIDYYQRLLQNHIRGSQLWRELKLQNQLGVTRGTLG